MDYIKDETDFFEIPDFLISWEWLKKAYPNKAKTFKLVEFHFIQGYKIEELADIFECSESQVRRDIKEHLEFVKTQLV